MQRAADRLRRRGTPLRLRHTETKAEFEVRLRKALGEDPDPENQLDLFRKLAEKAQHHSPEALEEAIRWGGSVTDLLLMDLFEPVEEKNRGEWEALSDELADRVADRLALDDDGEDETDGGEDTDSGNKGSAARSGSADLADAGEPDPKT